MGYSASVVWNVKLPIQLPDSSSWRLSSPLPSLVAIRFTFFGGVILFHLPVAFGSSLWAKSWLKSWLKSNISVQEVSRTEVVCLIHQPVGSDAVQKRSCSLSLILSFVTFEEKLFSILELVVWLEVLHSRLLWRIWRFFFAYARPRFVPSQCHQEFIVIFWSVVFQAAWISRSFALFFMFWELRREIVPYLAFGLELSKSIVTCWPCGRVSFRFYGIFFAWLEGRLFLIVLVENFSIKLLVVRKLHSRSFFEEFGDSSIDRFFLPRIEELHWMMFRLLRNSRWFWLGLPRIKSWNSIL